MTYCICFGQFEVWTVLFSVDGSMSATRSAVCLYTVLKSETSLKCISIQIHINNTNVVNSLQDVNTVIWWGAVISASRFHCSCSGVSVIFCSIALQDDMREKMSPFFPALIKKCLFPLWKCGLGGSGPGWNCIIIIISSSRECVRWNNKSLIVKWFFVMVVVIVVVVLCCCGIVCNLICSVSILVWGK